MPSKSKDDGITRFRMDTAGLVHLWRNHIASPEADDWKRFVLNCFERFSPEEYNTSELTSHDADWSSWSADKQYEFLSERCYSKCMTIKGKLKREKNYNVDLPSGYLSRTGAKKRKRVSLDDIANIFEGKDF